MWTCVCISTRREWSVMGVSMWEHVGIRACVTPARTILDKFFLPPRAAWSGIHCQYVNSLICKVTHCQPLIWNSPPVSDLQFTTSLWSEIHYQSLIWNSPPSSDLQFTAILWSGIHCQFLICYSLVCNSLQVPDTHIHSLPISDLEFTTNLW